jgi:hypothetical protein
MCTQCVFEVRPAFVTPKSHKCRVPPRGIALVISIRADEFQEVGLAGCVKTGRWHNNRRIYGFLCGLRNGSQSVLWYLL